MALASGKISLSFAKEVYPSGKITWIYHLQPGGAGDLMVRALIPFMEKYLKAISPSPKKVEVIMINLTGGEGLRAWTKVYKSKPDGYTLGYGDDKLHTWGITGRLGYDPFELTYIGRIGSASKVLVANIKSNIYTWDDVVKASPRDPVQIGLAGIGSSNHLAAFFLIDATKIAAKPVVFTGSAGAVAALIRGDVPIGLYPEDTVSSLVETKKVRPLLCLMEETVFPGVPDLKKIGFPELAGVTKSQRLITAPPKLPADIKKILVDALKKTLVDKEFITFNKKVGLKFNPLLGPEFDQEFKDHHSFIKSKQKLWREFVD